MADNIITYKCPCCDAPLVFDGKSGKMHCEHCDSSFDAETVKQYNEDLQSKVKNKQENHWTQYNSTSGSGDWTEDELNHVQLQVCPFCSAQIVADENTAATQCVYCGNQMIMKGRLSGIYRPDLLIPFKTTKADAKAKLKEFYHGKKLLPKVFQDENRIEKITGIYVPFWLYDCEGDADISYRATRVFTSRSGQYMVTRTDHFLVKRQGEIAFDKIPEDGSQKMDNTFMEAIEPFDYNEAIPFAPSYLSGFSADKYDVDANDNIPRVDERIKTSIEEQFSSTVIGYATVTPTKVLTNLKKSGIRYALLPVWMLNTKYHDKNYTFAMNGQTGKFVGELPTDRKKFWLWLFGVTASMAVILTAILLLVNGGSL